jgi:hypothetical protein
LKVGPITWLASRSLSYSHANFLKPEFFHFVLRRPFLCAIVELGGARALMRRHGLRVFERAAIDKIEVVIPVARKL